MTEDDPMTPEQLAKQDYKLAYFKGASNVLDYVLAAIDDLDDLYFEPLYNKFFCMQKKYIKAELTILESEEYGKRFDTPDQILLNKTEEKGLK